MSQEFENSVSNSQAPAAPLQAEMPAPVTAPDESFEAFIVSLGGKVVRGATPKSADAVEPDPEALAEHGGKYVGKAPKAADEPDPEALAEFGGKYVGKIPAPPSDKG